MELGWNVKKISVKEIRNPKGNVVNKFQLTTTTLLWNNALWLVKTSPITCDIQLQHKITLKFAYDIGSMTDAFKEIIFWADLSNTTHIGRGTITKTGQEKWKAFLSHKTYNFNHCFPSVASHIWMPIEIRRCCFLIVFDKKVIPLKSTELVWTSQLYPD